MILIGWALLRFFFCGMRIQLGLVTLTDGKTAPLAKGSRAGLARVRKQVDESAPIGNLALAIGREEHEVQTSLCEYDKYYAWTLNERPIRRRRLCEIWFEKNSIYMMPWSRSRTHNEDTLAIAQMRKVHDCNCNLYSAFAWDGTWVVSQKISFDLETPAADSSCELGVPFQGTPKVHAGIPHMNFGGPLKPWKTLKINILY